MSKRLALRRLGKLSLARRIVISLDFCLLILRLLLHYKLLYIPLINHIRCDKFRPVIASAIGYC